MIEPFEFSEIDDQDTVFAQYPNLKIDNSPAFYLILRGITGNLQIKQTFREFSFFQTRDLLNPVDKSALLPGENVTNGKPVDNELKTAISNVLEILKTKCKSNLEILPQYISDTFSLNDLSEVLKDKKIINRNRLFFESLNDEFSNFYYHTATANHTVAFLHLYRILEYVSYTFPVMYAASTKDFSKSFGILKTLFRGDKDKGELKVFKDFVNIVMSVEEDYKLLSIDIDIISDLEEYNERIYNTLINICDKNMFEESKNSKNSKLSVKFSEFSSFIITIRNRFFHLKNSQNNNIKSIDILDSEFFFGLINQRCAYFLSLVTLVVIKKSYFEK